MNALRWIAGFFGYFAVLGAIAVVVAIVFYLLWIVSTYSMEFLGIDIVRVLLIAGCCLFVGIVVAIGVRSNLWHIKKFCKQIVDAFLRI